MSDDEYLVCGKPLTGREYENALKMSRHLNRIGCDETYIARIIDLLYPHAATTQAVDKLLNDIRNENA